jgi:hypothetical protein
MARLDFTDTANEWPQEPLQSFVLRMADHGFSVSRTYMTCDRRYALDQLSQAHAMADEKLRELAMVLFRHFEQRRSGLAHVR